MKSIAFYRKDNQIFARYIIHNMEYANETVFDCDKEFGIIMFGEGGIWTNTFDSYEQAMEFVTEIAQKHQDYRKEFCDKFDFIFRKENKYIILKIVC